MWIQQNYLISSVRYWNRRREIIINSTITTLDTGSSLE